jgi:hypothetical protein
MKGRIFHCVQRANGGRGTAREWTVSHDTLEFFTRLDFCMKNTFPLKKRNKSAIISKINKPAPARWYNEKERGGVKTIEKCLLGIAPRIAN